MMADLIPLALTSSVTVNVCVGLLTLTSAVTGLVLESLSRRHATCAIWRDLHDNHKWMLPRFITDQVLTWVLLLPAFVLLCTGHHLTTSPFTTRGQDTDVDSVVTYLFAANVGRYVYKTFQDVRLMDRTQSLAVRIIHHVATIVCYVIMVIYGELYLLGLLGLVMEGTTLSAEVVVLQREVCAKAADDGRLVTALVNCAVSVLLRLVLPIALLPVGFSSQSPLSMTSPSLATMVFAITFYFFFNLALCRTAGLHVRNLIILRRLHCAPGLTSGILNCHKRCWEDCSNVINLENILVEKQHAITSGGRSDGCTSSDTTTVQSEESPETLPVQPVPAIQTVHTESGVQETSFIEGTNNSQKACPGTPDTNPLTESTNTIDNALARGDLPRGPQSSAAKPQSQRAIPSCTDERSEQTVYIAPGSPERGHTPGGPRSSGNDSGEGTTAGVHHTRSQTPAGVLRKTDKAKPANTHRRVRFDLPSSSPSPTRGRGCLRGGQNTSTSGGGSQSSTLPSVIENNIPARREQQTRSILADSQLTPCSNANVFNASRQDVAEKDSGMMNVNLAMATDHLNREQSRENREMRKKKKVPTATLR